MKVTPLATPSTPTPPQTSASTDARARAIAMLQGNQPAQAPVQNQNAISPEELGAISTKKPTDEQPEEIGHQDSTEDTQAPVAEETPKEDPALSRQFAQIARQEKALRAQMQALKAKEAEIKAKEASLQQQPQIDTSKYISKDMLKQDALSVLAEAGVSYEELTQQILNQPQRDPRVDATINELRNEIKKLQQQTEESKKSQVEQQSAQYQAAVKQIEADVNKLVFTDPAYEAIKASNATKDVVELITETYNQDGILLSVEEAAQQVEDYLVDQYTKFTNLNKIKQRLAKSDASTSQATPSTKTPEANQNKQTQPQMKTLTNTTSSSRPLSARERAMLAFKGELK
jgi:hypothetical protein